MVEVWVNSHYNLHFRDIEVPAFLNDPVANYLFEFSLPNAFSAD
jgi:hypothetical protein